MKNSPEKTSDDKSISEVTNTFRDLIHTLLRASSPAWADLRLTLPQLRTVFIIAHNRTSSVVQVAQQLGIGEPTASHLIDKLVQAGLVQRTEDPKDRRRVQVQLTPAGNALIERLLGWEDVLGELLHQLSKEELNLIRRGLSILLDKTHTDP